MYGFKYGDDHDDDDEDDKRIVCMGWGLGTPDEFS